MQKEKKSTAIIFNINRQKHIHVIHGTDIHRKVRSWLERLGLRWKDHDYYVTSS